MPPAAVTAHGKHQPLQWNIGKRPQEHRARPQLGLGRHRQRLQVGAPVLVHHTLRAAGGAARVVERQQRQLVVDRDPHRRRLPDQLLVVVVRPAGDHHTKIRNGGADRRDVLDQLVIDDEQPGAGVGDDVRQLIAAQARVEGVEHGTREGHTEVGLEQHVVVGREHRDDVARANSELRQPTGQLFAARQHLAVRVPQVLTDERRSIGEGTDGAIEVGGRRERDRAEGSVSMRAWGASLTIVASRP